jgi:hypothetical protein
MEQKKLVVLQPLLTYRSRKSNLSDRDPRAMNLEGARHHIWCRRSSHRTRGLVCTIYSTPLIRAVARELTLNLMDSLSRNRKNTGPGVSGSPSVTHQILRPTLMLVGGFGRFPIRWVLPNVQCPCSAVPFPAVKVAPASPSACAFLETSHRVQYT